MAKKSDNNNIALRKAVLAAEAQSEKKAEDIVVLDVHEICNFTDFIVICTGMSQLQFKAICDHVQEKLQKIGEKPFHIDGIGSLNWVVLDYVDVVIHVFSAEARAYYDLERLWGDGELIDWDSVLHELRA